MFWQYFATHFFGGAQRNDELVYIIACITLSVNYKC